MCKIPFWRLESWPLPPIPHKHLYLWSDHHTKGAWWYVTTRRIKKNQDGHVHVEEQIGRTNVEDAIMLVKFIHK